MNLQKTRLLFYTIGHFCVDGICAMTVLYQTKGFSVDALISFLIIYNFLAFVTQPLAGYFIDKTPRKKEIVLASFLILGSGFLLQTNRFIQVILVGIANCLFHVAAGADVLEEAYKKMWPLGVFVSSGAVGLTLGMIYPNNIILRLVLLFLLIFVFIGIFALKRFTQQKNASEAPTISYMILFGLLFCISIRSFMGFARVAPFENIAYLPLILSGFVFAGKFIGGFLCDWLSTKKVILLFVPLSALFYFIGDAHLVLWGTGQFLINISMPITLYLLYRAMPNRPAFGFGLAASFLIPGLIAAIFLLRYTIPLWIFGLIFIANFALLLIGNKKISEK